MKKRKAPPEKLQVKPAKKRKGGKNPLRGARNMKKVS